MTLTLVPKTRTLKEDLKTKEKVYNTTMNTQAKYISYITYRSKVMANVSFRTDGWMDRQPDRQCDRDI